MRSVDGLELGATLTIPDSPVAVAVHVHGGGGVDRHEWHGLVDRLASCLAESNIASLQFDHRCFHSAHNPEIDLTVSGVANDINVAVREAKAQFPDLPVHVVGGSFGGGAAVLWANHHPYDAQSLALMYPLLDYRQRILESKTWWDGKSISEDAVARLKSERPLRHTPRVRISRAFLNESALFETDVMMGQLDVPVLIIHGTEDDRTPYETSARLAASLGIELMTLEGADHGFSIPGDVEHRDEQTHRYQRQAFDRIAEWIS